MVWLGDVKKERMCGSVVKRMPVAFVARPTGETKLREG